MSGAQGLGFCKGSIGVPSGSYKVSTRGLGFYRAFIRFLYGFLGGSYKGSLKELPTVSVRLPVRVLWGSWCGVYYILYYVIIYEKEPQEYYW